MHHACVKNQVAEVLSHLPADGTDSVPLKDKLPDLVIASYKKKDYMTTTIFDVEAHISTPTPSATNADGTDVALPT